MLVLMCIFSEDATVRMRKIIRRVLKEASLWQPFVKYVQRSFEIKVHVRRPEDPSFKFTSRLRLSQFELVS